MSNRKYRCVCAYCGVEFRGWTPSQTGCCKSHSAKANGKRPGRGARDDEKYVAHYWHETRRMFSDAEWAAVTAKAMAARQGRMVANG